MSFSGYQRSEFAGNLEERPSETLPWPALPLVVLALLYAIFFALLAYFAATLPPRVASHFNAHGQPDGWMSRGAFLMSMGWLGGLMPLFMLSLALVMRAMPSSLINVPHREYWLSPENRPVTSEHLSRFMAWLACFLLMFFTGLTWLVADANRQQPPRLSAAVWVLTAAFLVAVTGAIVRMYWHFCQAPQKERADAR